MRYLKLYENFNNLDIDNICYDYDIENYTINDDGTIDVDGDVDLSDCSLMELPLKFKNVSGDFYCSDNNLTSLEGCPEFVNNFDCSENELTSLEGCPKFVNGYFNCNENKLTSLEFYPNYVSGDFNCFCNKLTSFEFMSKCDNFNVEDNNIRDFKYFVEPNGEFSCDDNPIFSIWRLFRDKSYIDLLNEYDFIRGEDIIVDRLNQFLEEIDKDTVGIGSVRRYNNI